MTSGLQVRIDGVAVGSLWLDGRKRFCFQYDEEWLTTSRIPLSLSLPLRREPYDDDESHPFFANLLPEEKIRTVIARNLGVSLNNDYGLLEKIGGAGDPDSLQKKHWKQFAEDIGIKPRLVLNRIADLAKRIEDSRLQLFKVGFAPYRCDGLYRLMEFIGGQTERTLRRIT